MRINYSLLNHPEGYSFSKRECLLGLIYSPYARRHYELSQCAEEPFPFGHKVIAFIEGIPFLGFIGSLIERIVVLTCESHFPLLLAKEYSSQGKMLRNFCKALVEHGQGYDVKELTLLSHKHPKSHKLNLNVEFSHKQGRRKKLKNAYFSTEIKQGHLAGIFDGHKDGGVIAQLAASRFQHQFSEIISLSPLNLQAAFQQMMNNIHREISDIQLSGGCTGVVCFIDKRNNLIYTATLGDAEAAIYRKMQGIIKSIPLSCVRNWLSPKDTQRAIEALGNDVFGRFHEPLYHLSPKSIRFPDPIHGCNVSRSLGNLRFNQIEGKPGVIPKCKVTKHYLQPDDLLIIGCKGLWNYVSNQQIIQYIIDNNNKENNLSETVANYVLNTRYNKKNITVITIQARNK